MNPFIKLENVSFAYRGEGGPHPVLSDLSLEIQRGSFVAVLGHNGSGKSTLAKLLNLILTPRAGKIYIDGLDVTAPELTEDEVIAVRRKVGMVFQNPDNQLVATVVEEDVAFGPENLGVPPAEIRTRVDEALATVGMTEFARHSPHQLSGGQKQRIAIAGVLAMQPDCIIFDESTAMLDPAGRAEVMETIHRLHREGMTILLITHNMDEAVQAERVVVLNDGGIYLDGTPTQVFSQVKALRSVGLDVPQVTELFFDLREAGLDLPGGVFDEETGVATMLAALSPYLA